MSITTPRVAQHSADSATFHQKYSDAFLWAAYALGFAVGYIVGAIMPPGSSGAIFALIWGVALPLVLFFTACIPERTDKGVAVDVVCNYFVCFMPGLLIGRIFF